MLIPLPELIRRHGLDVSNVLHIGCHQAEEAKAYHRAKVGEVWWVEAIPSLIPEIETILAPYPDQHIIEACCTDVDHGTATLNITNNVQSSSIYPLGTHAVVSPDVHYVGTVEVETRTVDSLVAEHGIRANFANLDCQGAEGLILAGATTFLAEQCEWLYCELSAESLYEGGVLFHELTAFLYERGFTIRQMEMAGTAGWGDGLWVRTPDRG